MTLKQEIIYSSIVLAWLSGFAFAVITLGGLIWWWAGVLGKFLGILG